MKPIPEPRYIGTPKGPLWLVLVGNTITVDFRIRGRHFHFATWRDK